MFGNRRRIPERQRPAVELLEPRVLYSADLSPAALAGGALLGPAEHRLLDQPVETRAVELVFVDTATPDYQVLIDDITRQAGPARDIEVILLDGETDGIEQITEALSGRSDVSAVHIISHGSGGAVQLGAGTLDAQTLHTQEALIASWRDALTADADLLFYGCDIAATAQGRALMDALAGLTGADVAASADNTGHAALGGNWGLEYRIGAIEAHLALSQEAQDEWFALLASVAGSGEIQVNTTLPGNQTEANVAMDSNGNFVAVWTADDNLDGNGKGIFAQRFDASGNKLGAEVPVNTTTASDQTQASVAMDPSGNYVVVWMSNNQDPDASDGIYAQRYNPSGVAQGGEFRVNGTISGDQVSPSVAMDASGNFTVVWTSNQNGNLDVFARQYNAAGIPLGAEILVNTTLAGGQSEANVAIAASGNFVVVWTADGNLDGNGKGIFAQRFDASGSKLGAEVRVNTAIANDQSQAAVAMDPTGNYVVVWTSDKQDGDKTGIYAQRFDAAGAAQGGEFRVNTQTNGAQDSPSVAIDGAGRFTVAWTSNNQDGANKGIYAQSYDAAGFRIGSEFQVNVTTAGAQLLPSIAMRGNGDFVVAWAGRSATDPSGIAARPYLSLNQPPVNVVPGAQVAGGVAHVFSTAIGNAIQVSDIDAGGALERVTLTATNGTLTLSQTTGLSFSAGDGTADATMTFDGTLAAINAALDGMSFTATPFFSGAASVQILSNDLGFTGAGGSLTDTDTVNITVVSVGTPFIISGSYTGNAVDNRSITGLGFAPDVVIVKARDSNELGVIRTSTMAGDLTKELTSGTALVANEIQSLDANGFTIGTSDTVNKAAVTYDWIAFRTSPGFLTVGTYTGDGTAGRTVTGLGFSPDALFVFDAGNEKAVFTNSSAGGNAFEFVNSTNPTWITALGTDGFTVGSDQRVNGPGRTYHYVAWNEVPGLMDVGSYAGNGLDNRDIAGVGFQPEWVVVKNTAGDAVVQHFDSQGAATDSSSFFSGISANTNRIQQLQADGFQVGADNDVNNSGRTYTYMAFRQETPPTISDVVDQVVTEDTPTAAIAFTVGDAETAAGSLSVVASSSNQIIVPDVNIVIGGSGAARTVTITPAPDQFGTVTITLRVSDGFAVATDTFVLTINPINDPPTVSAPPEIGVNEDEASALAGISFADPDAGAGSLQATFTVPQGTLSATSGGGVNVGGTAANLTLTGTLADINAFIAAGNLDYITALNDNSNVTLGVLINDLGNSGVGGPLSSPTSNVTLNVTAINDAPEHTIPAAQNTATNTAVIFSTGNGNAISVSDVDAGSNPIEMTLSVSNGTLTLAGTTGLTFSVGSGTGDASMTFIGTIADINVALDGLRYDPVLGFTGNEGLNITSDDLGNSGDGGSKIVNDTAVINVAFVNSAPVLSGANDLGAIDEDPATNPGTLVSALITAPLQVGDADVGALSGIAVTAVDNTDGTWQYSTNGGSTWIAFGSPSVAAARLLAADADTFVRFVPNANFNGTIASGLTFRAWDRTFGAAGGTADTATPVANTVRDNFGVASYINDDGSASWAGGWVDVDGNPAAGNIRIAGGQLVLAANLSTDSIFREANLSGATSATLSFSYDNQLFLGLGGSITLEASSNGGGSYTPLATFSPGSNSGVGVFSTDITAYAAANTRIRFSIGGLSIPSQSLFVDDLQIAYVTPASGGSTAFSSATASASITVNPVNDVPVGVPAITGTVTEDQVLTADTSGISDADGLGAFSYQWLRNGAPIATATASTYTLGDADVGTLISVQVSYTDAQGTAEGPLTSVQTAAVANINDAPVGVPTITGTVTEDQMLTADASGISDVDGVGAFGYQWLRNGAPIASATASTYTLGDADVGTLISVQVSYTDAQGTAEGPLTSVQTAAVANINDAPVGVPTITGTVTEDQLLTADTSGISDADGLGAFSYQWLRNGAPIATATASTYTLGDTDVGTLISVQVSYTDAQGTAEGPQTSVQTAAVANINDAPVGAPTITGTVAEDQVLTADATGISDADGLGAFSYQWLRGGVAISGATASTYTLGDADVGTLISVQVSYADAQGTLEGPLTSVQTAAVVNVNDAPVGAANTIAVPQDGAHVFSASDFGFSDPNDNPANALLAVRITTVPTAGVLTNNGTAVTAGQFVSAADIGAGLLVFAPLAGASGAGYASFNFQVQDDGGGSDLDGSPRALTFNVNASAVIVLPPPLPGPIVPPPPLDPIPPPEVAPPPPAASPSPTPAAIAPRAAGGGDLFAFEVSVSEGTILPPLVSREFERDAVFTVGLRTFSPGSLPGEGIAEAVTEIRLGQGILQLAQLEDVLSSASRPQSLAEEINSLRETLSEQAQLQQVTVGALAVGGLSLTVGYVLWIVRGGVLVASLLSTLPAWRFLDPLPILAQDDDEDEDAEGGEDDDDVAFQAFLEEGAR